MGRNIANELQMKGVRYFSTENVVCLFFSSSPVRKTITAGRKTNRDGIFYATDFNWTWWRQTWERVTARTATNTTTETIFQQDLNFWNPCWLCIFVNTFFYEVLRCLNIMSVSTTATFGSNLKITADFPPFSLGQFIPRLILSGLV